MWAVIAIIKCKVESETNAIDNFEGSWWELLPDEGCCSRHRRCRHFVFFEQQEGAGCVRHGVKDTEHLRK